MEEPPVDSYAYTLTSNENECKFTSNETDNKFTFNECDNKFTYNVSDKFTSNKSESNNITMSSNFPLSPIASKSSSSFVERSIQQKEESLISPLEISNFDWETAAAASMPKSHANGYYHGDGVQHSDAWMPLPIFSSSASVPRRASCPGTMQQSFTGHVDVFSQHIPQPQPSGAAAFADHVDVFSQHIPHPQPSGAAAFADHVDVFSQHIPHPQPPEAAAAVEQLPPRKNAPPRCRRSTVDKAPPASMISSPLAANAMQRNVAGTANDKSASPNSEEIFSFSDLKSGSIRPDFPSSQAAFHDKQLSFEENQVCCDQSITHPTTLSISSDEKFLDPVQNFLRSACIEVFVASDQNPGRGAKPHQLGQVGLRCGHCKHVHRSKRAKQAVSYPSKTTNIFESVRNFQRTHFEACVYIPDELKTRYKKLILEVYRKIQQKYIKAYYAEAACEIGLVDTPHGIIFGAPPNLSGKPSKKLLAIMKMAENPAASAHLEELIFPKVDRRLENLKLSHLCSESTRQVIALCRQQKTVFVYPSDFPTISDFRFVLFHQFDPCRPPSTALNRRKNRPEKWDTLSGLCCRYCARAHPGERSHRGMYFPLDLESLHDSSLSHNLTVHLTTCQHAPFEIKEALEELQRLAAEIGVTTKRGSKKIFLQKLWERMANYYPGR